MTDRSPSPRRRRKPLKAAPLDTSETGALADEPAPPIATEHAEATRIETPAAEVTSTAPLTTEVDAAGASAASAAPQVGSEPAPASRSAEPPSDEPSTPVLELKGVRGAYGRIEVLHGVDLVVPEGSVVALLGPNGGGKTTTLKIASGQMSATAGCVHIGGRHVNGASPDALARLGVCTIPEGRGVFPNLSVRENLRMVTYGGVTFDEVEEKAYLTFPRLKERRSQLAGTMSGGEQQMLALARGLAVNPVLLFLDELSMGLAPLIVEELYEIVAQVAKTGVSILVVEQFARTVLGVADYAAIMLHGQVTSVGQPADVAPELEAAYMGT